MRKTHFLMTMPLIALLSCDWKVPETISVKTDATFFVNAGTADYDLGEFLGPEEITKKMKESLENCNVFNYDDGNDILTYLVQYPIYEVPVNVGQYIDKMNLDSILSGTNGIQFEQEISLPAVEFDQVASITIPNVSEEVKTKMGTSVGGLSEMNLTSIAENGRSSDNPLVISKTDNGFQIVTISSDCGVRIDGGILYKDTSFFNITVNKKDDVPCGADYKFIVTAYIVESEEYGVDFDPDNTDSVTLSKVYTKSVPTNVSTGGVVRLPLHCETTEHPNGLPSEFRVMFKAKISGGTLGTVHAYSVKLATDNVEISKIIDVSGDAENLGITMPEIDQEIDLSSMVGYFKTGKIGEGLISVSADRPSAFDSSIQLAVNNLKINGAGLTDLTFSDKAESTKFIDKELNLAGKVLTPTVYDSTIKISGTTSLVFNHTTLEIDSSAEDTSMDIIVAGGVTKLESATIDFTSDKYASVPTSYNVDAVNLDSQLLKTVKYIDFPKGANAKHDSEKAPASVDGDGFGITCETYSNFPEGNNLPVKLHSSIFEFDPPNFEISPSADYVSQTWTDSAVLDLTSYTYTEDDTKPVDFSVTITDNSIPGVNSLTLNNLEMGQTYKFGLKNVRFVADWDEARIDFSGIMGASNSFGGEISFENFDMKKLFEDLELGDDIDNIKMKSIPSYFYIQQPKEGFDIQVGIKGDISIEYQDTNGASNTAIFLEKTETHSPVPRIKWEGLNDAQLRDLIQDGKYSFKSDNLTDVINNKPSAMNLKYDIEIANDGGQTSTTVFNENIKTLDSVDIVFDMLIKLAFDIELTGDISVNIMKKAFEDWNTPGTEDGDKDLLSRDDASTLEDFVKYADGLDSFSVDYYLSNNVIDGVDVEISLTDEKSGVNKTVSGSSNRNNKIQLSMDEIKSVMTNYPFHPNVSVALKGGTSTNPNSICIRRNPFVAEGGAKVSATVSAKIDMDGNSKIKIWGDD